MLKELWHLTRNGQKLKGERGSFSEGLESVIAPSRDSNIKCLLGAVHDVQGAQEPSHLVLPAGPVGLSAAPDQQPQPH